MAYTPSFSLLGAESLILEQSDIGAISDSIKDCLRCGKCKPVCSTHVPRANLLYSPRNKILGVGLLTEAFLYEEQTRRGVSLKHFEELSDVADHCTVCHRCVKPRPVKIDFGDVSVAMRNFLRKTGNKSFNPGTAVGMAFLTATPGHHQGLAHRPGRRRLQGAAAGQRGGQAPGLDRLPDPATAGHRRQGAGQGAGDPLHQQAHARRPAQENRARAAGRGRRQHRAHHPQPQAVGRRGSGVLLPGCGSERLFSQVGLATQAMLWHVGAQTVLPPGYLCCGYPQTSAGYQDKGDAITTENRVLFHRVATTLNYLDIKTVVVSCGTCYDQLSQYRFEDIFPAAASSTSMNT